MKIQSALDGVAVVGLAAWGTMVVWSLWAAVLAFRMGLLFKSHCVTPKSSSNKKSLPHVTILRPLRGVDCTLEQNLISTCTQNYPNFTCYLCVADSHDSSLPTAKRVVSRYPHTCRLIVGEELVSVNPKVNNLIRGYRSARHDDIVWICDSNVSCHSDTLQVAVDSFLSDSKIGLVHHAPEGVKSQSLGARLEQMFLNTAHAKIYLFINWTGLDSCVMGKSVLFRKSLLDSLGGLGFYGRFLNEDNQIGLAVFRAGYRHHLSFITACQPLFDTSLMDYALRRSRWTRIRAYSMPVVTLIEPFTECITCGLVGAMSISHLFHIGPIFALFLIHVLLWFTIDLVLVSNFCRRSPPSLLEFIPAWILRELSCIPIYLYSIFGSNRIQWRSRQYALRFGGFVKPVYKNSPAGSNFILDLISLVLQHLPLGGSPLASGSDDTPANQKVPVEE